MKTAGDFAGAFDTAVRGRVRALIMDDTSLITRHYAEIAELALKSRLPAIAHERQFAVAGLLMTYGVNGASLERRRAALVDRILRGTRPADLPVEQPTVYDFVVNLRTAGTFGLTIPDAILLRATEGIR